MDDLGGKWWNHISVAKFGFLERISSNLNDYSVDVDDILIHKEIKSGERFPTIRYHKVTKDSTIEIQNKEVKGVLQKRLVKYIRDNKKFPFACGLAKFFKNGSAQVNFTPTQYDKFVLKIIPNEHNIDSTEEFFKDLETDTNPIKSDSSKKQTSGKQWLIESSSDKTKKYTISLQNNGSWTCTCPQYVYRKAECRHIKQCKNKANAK